MTVIYCALTRSRFYLFHVPDVSGFVLSSQRRNLMTQKTPIHVLHLTTVELKSSVLGNHHRGDTSHTTHR